VVVSNAFGAVTSRLAVLAVSAAIPLKTVLFFFDSTYWTSPYATALNNLGLPHQPFGDDSAFSQALAGANPANTLVVVDAIDWGHDFSGVAGFVQSGGRAILYYWGLAPGNSLAAAFNASVVQQINSPTPVYDWGGSSLFAGVTSPLAFNHSAQIDGQRLEPASGGQALAGCVSTPTAQQAAIVVGNQGRTMLNGFMLEQATSAAQAVQLVRNEIQLLADLGKQGAPFISTQPQGREVKLGSSATFVASALGNLPLFYQWYHNGTRLSAVPWRWRSGETPTNATLTITNVGGNDAGGYFLVVSNAYGQVLSELAALQVLAAPVFTQHPQSQTVVAGSDLTLSVGATGTLPLSYRWRRGSTTLTNLILDRTSCSFAVTNVPMSTAGVYTVQVTNLAGPATGGRPSGLSSNAYLTVVAPPTNQTVPAASNVTFQARASGGSGNPLSYQWRFNGMDLPGATGTNLTLTSVQTSQAGTYTFVVTNGGGEGTGFDALLTVLSPTAPTIGRCAMLANGRFHFQFNGSSGASYRVLASANLSDWEDLGAAAEIGPGVFQFEDDGTPNRHWRFYRLRLP
jgi:hypothetical protein